MLVLLAIIYLALDFGIKKTVNAIFMFSFVYISLNALAFLLGGMMMGFTLGFLTSFLLGQRTSRTGAMTIIHIPHSTLALYSLIHSCQIRLSVHL